MAIKVMKGTAASFDDLITQIIAWVTDKTVHGDDAWTLMRNVPWPSGTILRAAGRKSGEYQYIGLLPNAIKKGKTYADWFLQRENLATYFVWSAAGLNRPGQNFDVGGMPFTDTPDIFEASAQVLHLGVFKQYAADLDWHEQGGGMDFSGIQLRPLQYRQGNSNADYYPPLLPGCGYPALSMDFTGPTIGVFKFWLIKDAQRLIIAMNNAEVWDSAFLGQFEPYDSGEYAFPAAVIGGTSGSVSTGGNYWYSSNQKSLVPVIGIRLDYRPQQWSLTHGIAPFATAAADAAGIPTQAMLCHPDGTWQGYANYVQGVTAVADHVCSGYVTNYHFVRQEPARPGNIKCSIRPVENDIEDFAHGYGQLKLEPVEFLQMGGERQGILGKLPYMLFPSQPIHAYGEITISGKKYLSIPNGWEDRKFHLPGHAGIVYDCDPEALLAEERRIEKISKMMNLLIKLEE
jgi:hypothetical protein